jgi:hypothetical protein
VIFLGIEHEDSLISSIEGIQKETAFLQQAMREKGPFCNRCSGTASLSIQKIIK